MMQERTLVTGFGPFLNVEDNPSARLAAALNRPHRVLEVSYEAVDAFIGELDPNSFDRLLMMGVASERAHLCPELFARNVYGSTSDVSGSVRTGSIRPREPLLLNTTLFTESALASLLIANPQMRVSMDAGAYLCNFAYYQALTAFKDKRVGFLHVPHFDRIPFETQAQAIESLLKALEV
jgi:pyroglutamyl-peptidase